MTERIVPYRVVITVGAALLLVILGLVALNIAKVDAERDRAVRAEQEIVQETIDRIALVARTERVTSCEADDVALRGARRLLRLQGLPIPREFRPRNCSAIGDEYAQRLREAGPLVERTD